MELQLPNLNGKTLIKTIKERSQGQETTIIAFTASSFKQQQDEILATGCDGYLKKPSTANEIFKTIQHYLPVDYLYLEVSEAANRHAEQLNHSPQFLSERLQKLPEAWLLEFHHGILTGSPLQMSQLLQQLSETQADVAKVLGLYVSEYRYQELLMLLTPLCQTAEMMPGSSGGNE